MPVFGSTFGCTNLPSFASSTKKQGEPLSAPGSAAACKPPPVHLCSLRSASHTHSRVRSALHEPAALAQSSQADIERSPRDATFLLAPAYRFTMSRYSWAAGLRDAAPDKNGA